MDNERKPTTVECAGFWIRLAACLIDAAVLSLVVFAIVVATGAYERSSGGGQHIVPVSLEPATADTVVACVGALLPPVYTIGFWTWRGQTPGKTLVGAKVVRTDGYPIGFARSVVRYAGYIVCVLTLFVGFRGVVVDPARQGLHDRLADTYVVKLPRNAAKRVQIYE